MNKKKELESFRNNLIKLMAFNAPSVDAEGLMSNNLVVIRPKGGGVHLLIGFRGVRMLGLMRLRRLECAGSCRHVLKMVEEAFTVLAIK